MLLMHLIHEEMKQENECLEAGGMSIATLLMHVSD